jgi:hypothetical protein
MAKTDQSVDQYLKQQPAAARKQLDRVRRTIQKAVRATWCPKARFDFR